MRITMKDKNYTLNEYNHGYGISQPEPPISTIYIGKDTGMRVGVDKKFNWFQKKMIKWCFGFDVKENL